MTGKGRELVNFSPSCLLPYILKAVLVALLAIITNYTSSSALELTNK